MIMSIQFPSESLFPNHVSLPSSTSCLFGFGDCCGGRGQLFCFVLISNQVQLGLLICARMRGIHWSLGILPSTTDTLEPKPLGCFCPKKHQFFFKFVPRFIVAKQGLESKISTNSGSFHGSVCPVHRIYLTSLHLAQSFLDKHFCKRAMTSVAKIS